MKGPYQRLKFDLRRLWECPVCKRRERTAGSVTFRHCSCQMKQLDGQPVGMNLIADAVQRLTPPVQIHHETLPVSAPPEPTEGSAAHSSPDDSPTGAGLDTQV